MTTLDDSRESAYEPDPHQGYDDTLDHIEAPPPVPTPTVYQSPLMRRMAESQERLSTSLLAEEIPKYQAGIAAQALLDSEDDLTPSEHRKAAEAIVIGEDAKERLVTAGMPLIAHVARQEWTRRQNWRSQVGMDELVQEGTIGFMRGLRAYKVTSQNDSATNYLGMWIQIQIRRNVETLDNDFAVPHDHTDTIRKVRAVRSRLINELGREPTDEEVLEAAEDVAHRGGKKLGRVNKTTKTGKPAKPKMSQADIELERETRTRVGATTRAIGTHTDDDSTLDVYDLAQPLDSGQAYQPEHQEAVDEHDSQEGLARLLFETFNHMRLSPTHREIIARKYGLPPHEKGEGIRQISLATTVRKESVEEILEAFQQEMVRPGGTFHRVCSGWDADDLYSMGLGWTIGALGKWEYVDDSAKSQPLPQALTDPVQIKQNAPPLPPHQPTLKEMPVVRAQFVCDYHAFGFIGVYPSRLAVPKQRACPQANCGRPSPLRRVLTA